MIAHTLFSKNIPFCIYRFPTEKRLRIAIDSDMLPHPKKNDFWMTPFCEKSEAKDIHWCVLGEEFRNEDFLNKLSNVSRKEIQDVPLPGETSKEKYLNIIDAYLNEIHSGKLDKAVLSRVVHATKPANFDPIDCFQRLERAYPDTFVHLSLHPQSGIWMGATPELLLQKRSKEISVMALAGTQLRKDTGMYQWRTKELEEHRMVGQHIDNTFIKHDFSLTKKDGPNTIETGKVAHLRTNYVFEEKTPVSLKSLLKELHPTPAVGGLPSEEGLKCILANEGYDRRYYCGFLGETSSDDSADLYINLRCMQIGKEKIAIYVGGGITAASDPEEEWQETILKSKTMAEKIDEEKR